MNGICCESSEECICNTLYINVIYLCINEVRAKFCFVILYRKAKNGRGVPHCPAVPPFNGTGQWDSGTKAIINHPNKASHEQLFITEV